MAKVVTPLGFPWPRDYVLYHATVALPRVLSEGFRTREQTGAAGLGGGSRTSISVTTDPRVAEAIALGLRVLQRGVKRQLPMEALLDDLSAELPAAVPEAMKSLMDNDGLDRRRIRRWDEGWVHVRADWPEDLPEGAEGDRPWEHGARPLWSSWWSRPESRTFRTDWDREYAEKKWRQNEVAYALYKSFCFWGQVHKACYDPCFFCPGLDWLLEAQEDDIGVIALKSHVAYVAAGSSAAFQMGYLDRRTAHYWSELLDSRFGHRIAQDLASSYRSMPTLDVYGAPVDGKLGPWTILNELPAGFDVTRDLGRMTMSCYPAEAELRIFDVSQIEVLAGSPIHRIAQKRPWGHRLTHPYFEPGDGLSGAKPGEIVLGKR